MLYYAIHNIIIQYTLYYAINYTSC